MVHLAELINIYTSGESSTKHQAGLFHITRTQITFEAQIFFYYSSQVGGFLFSVDILCLDCIVKKKINISNFMIIQSMRFIFWDFFTSFYLY